MEDTEKTQKETKIHTAIANNEDGGGRDNKERQ